MTTIRSMDKKYRKGDNIHFWVAVIGGIVVGVLLVLLLAKILLCF